MTRLTFGVTCSPFLATHVLHQLAEDHNQEYSRTADIIWRSFYVDDCLTGASSLEEASDIRKELNLLLDRDNTKEMAFKLHRSVGDYP